MNPDQDSFLFYFEKLIAFFSTEESSPDLTQARGEYFSLINPFPTDGPLYESRLALFLDWFIFDRKYRNGQTAVQYYYEVHASRLNPEENEIFRNFLNHLHSIFHVKQINTPEIKIQDLVDQQVYAVFERRSLNIQEGDLCDCRLIPFQGNIYFTGAFCYHPREVLPFLKRLLKPVQQKQAVATPILTRLVSLNNTWNLHYPHADPGEVYEKYGS
ncbi:MAG: hypothetical protein NT009_14600 [Proteobacteria bacterium]|nr:hypothetical protein [Pseudomonadota bacterium]